MVKANPHRLKSGKIVWRVQFRVDGSVKTESFPTQAGGDKFAALVDRVGGKAAREVLARHVQNDTSNPTLAEWCETYLDPASGILTGIQPGTRRGYERIVKSSLLPQLGDYPIDTITRDDIGRWVQWQEEQPSGRHAGQLVSAKTVKNYQALLSNIFKAAVERGKIQANPVRGVKVTPGQSREGVFLSPVEFAQILEAVPVYYRPLVIFLANTGVRWGEATALTWADIELGKRPPTASINKAWKKGVDGRPVLGPPKSRKSRRTVPLNDKILAYLPEKGGAKDLVFPGRGGGRIWYGMFNTRIWKPSVERASIGKVPNIHDLRHTHASWLLAAGAPLNLVQAQLGHEKIDTTVSVYGHLAPGAHGDIVNVLNAAMVSVPDPVIELEA